MMTKADKISDHISKFETTYLHISSRCYESTRKETTTASIFFVFELINDMWLFCSH